MVNQNVLVCIAAAMGAADLGAGSNLVTNPNFEQKGNPAEGWGPCPSSQFSRVQDVVHTPAKSALRQSNDNPANYHTCTQVVPGAFAGHRYNASVWVKSANISGKGTGATLCVEFSGANGGYIGGAYPPGVKGSTDWTQIWTVVQIPSSAEKISIDVYTRKGMSGTAWFDTVSMEQIDSWAELQTTLLSPAYRGRIASTPSTEGCKAIRLNASINYPSYDNSSSYLQLVATLTATHTQKPTETVTLEGPQQIQPSVIVTFNTTPSSLAPGQYTVKCVLRNISSTEVLASSNHTLTRVADSSPEPTASIDEQLRLIVNSKPVFPLGLYLSSITKQDLHTIGNSKFNVIMPYRPPSNISVMDDIHNNGLSVMFSTKDSYFGGPNAYKSIITSREKEKAFIKSQVDKYKDHPALLGWYLNDELNVQWISDLEAHYRWTSDQDPNHPAWAVLYEASELRQYLGTFDVVGTDPYPINKPYNRSSPDGQAAAVGREVDISLAGIESSRPLWEVIQAHNLRNYKKDCVQCRTPNAQEERSMAWQAICRGANGIFYYSYFDIQRNDDVPFSKQWSILCDIAEEIDRFAPVLLSNEGPAPAVTVTMANGISGDKTSPEWLSTRARWMPRSEVNTTQAADLDFFLFVANDGNGHGAVTYHIDSSVGTIGPKGVTVVSESQSRIIKPDAGGMSFSDQVDILEVVVYQFTPLK